jgi:hypothetical protein
MTDRLAQMLAAERAQAPTRAHTSEGWQALQSALSANTPALAVGSGPLKLGMSLATKAFLGSTLVAFAVTTAGLGAHELVTTPGATPGRPTPVAAAVAPTSGASSAPPAELPAPLDTPAAHSAPPVARASAPVREPSTLADELRLLKAAKVELDAGHPHLAGIWLEQHAQLYPNGSLARERESLRERLPAESRQK